MGSGPQFSLVSLTHCSSSIYSSVFLEQGKLSSTRGPLNLLISAQNALLFLGMSLYDSFPHFFQIIAQMPPVGSFLIPSPPLRVFKENFKFFQSILVVKKAGHLNDCVQQFTLSPPAQFRLTVSPQHYFNISITGQLQSGQSLLKCNSLPAVNYLPKMDLTMTFLCLKYLMISY